MATAGRTSSRLLVPDPEIAKAADLPCSALQTAVDRVNADLSVIEKVRRFIVADEPFTIENEQLTPSMKIRRHVISKVYGERLDALYGDKRASGASGRRVYGTKSPNDAAAHRQSG